MKIKNVFIPVLIFSLITSTISVSGQTLSSAVPAEITDKAKEFTAVLSLADAAKKAAVEQVIATHMLNVRDWHNQHPPSTVPAGINPVTGNKLTDLDRQIIADSAMPETVHTDLMTGLNNNLSPTQVEAILDKYTVGKVAFTMKGYKAIVPDLTADEEAKILALLKQAREQAVDYKSMKQISAIFEIYKTKSEQLLNNNGRSWRALYNAYTKKLKDEKAKKAQE
jgi:carboxylesterase type B